MPSLLGASVGPSPAAPPVQHHQRPPAASGQLPVDLERQLALSAALAGSGSGDGGGLSQITGQPNPKATRSSRLGLFKRSSTLGSANANASAASNANANALAHANATSASSSVGSANSGGGGGCGSLQDLNPAQGAAGSHSSRRQQESDLLRANRRFANQQQQHHQLLPGQHKNHQLLLTAQNQHLLGQPDPNAPHTANHPGQAHFPNMQLMDYGPGQHQQHPGAQNHHYQQHQQQQQASMAALGLPGSHQNQLHHQLQFQPHHLQQQQQQNNQHHQQNTIHYKSHTTDSGSLALSSEQCNEQEHEDRPSCIQIMKRLFFSLVLGTIIAICWVIIIHTLKWIAIKGNEFEQLNYHQQQQLHLHHRSSLGAAALDGAGGSDGGNGNGGGGGENDDEGSGGPNILAPPEASFRLNQAASLLALQSAEGAPAAGLTVASLPGPQSTAADPLPAPAAYQEARAAPALLVGQVGPRDVPLAPARVDEAMRVNGTAVNRDNFTVVANWARLRRKAASGDGDGTDDDDDGGGTDQTVSESDRHQQPTSLALATDIRHTLRRPQQQKEPTTSSSQTISSSSSSPSASALSPQNQRQQATTARNQFPLDHRKRIVHLSSIVPYNQPQQGTSVTVAPPPLVVQDFSQSGYFNEEPLKSEASSNSNSMVLGPEASQAQAQAQARARAQAQAQEPPSITGQWPSAPAVDPTRTSSLEARGTPLAAGLVYRAPFFTSWFVSIWNILFMPVFTLISSCCFRNEDSTTKKLLVESISQFMDNGLTTLQFLVRCAFFSVLWIGTIFGIVYSLSNIDATVVMALFACSAALVYLLSWVLLHQQFVGVRIVAVIICTTGIALLAYMDNSRTLGSVLIVAGSALCSAIYKVIYQRMFGFWSIAQMSLFFTLIGLFNAFLMWPIALLLYFLGVELIAWRYIPWMHLTAAGALHLTANIVAYFGPICSYDIFLTMGLLLAVILSAVIDVTFYKITFFGMKLAGVLLLMIGFLVCLLPENWNEFLYDLVNERFIRWKKQRNLKKSRNKVQDLSTGQMSRLRTPSGRVK